MKKSLLAISIVLLGGLSSIHAQCVGFFDGFESGSYTPTWTIGSGLTSAAVTTTNPYSGLYRLEGTGGTSTHLTGLSTNIPVSTPSNISWDIYPTGTGASNYMVLGDAAVSATNCVAFCYWQGGTNIRFVSSVTSVFPCPAGAWYHIEMRNVNYTSHTFDIYINNALVYTSFPFRSATQNNVSRIHLYNFNASVGVWDNITLGNLPPTTTNIATSVSCSGGNNGGIDLTVAGGTAPFTYAWSNSATTQDLTGIIAGTYTVTVTDAAGCTATSSVTITEPSLLTFSYNSTDVLCNGGANGTASAIASGGTAPYTYLWSNGSTSSTANGLASGNYSCTVTCANGCVATQTSTVYVGEPTLLLASASAGTIACNGGITSITYSGSGGTSPYTGEGTNTFVVVGTYTNTITDANGCSATSTTVITEPSAIQTQVNTVNVNCYGDSTGSIDLTVSGGTAPYTFDWNSGTYTTEDLTGLAVGTYVGVLTDSNGCTDGGTIIITGPSAALMAGPIIAMDPTTCGGTDGMIDVTTSGGTMPYSFAWNTTDTTEDISAIGAGVYSCVVTDSNGCSINLADTLTDPAAPVVALTLATNIVCVADGAFMLAGGTPAGGVYSGPGVSGGSFDPFAAGVGTHMIMYMFTDSVTLCSASMMDSINVDVCTAVNINADLASHVSIYPNPNSGTFNLAMNINVTELFVEVTDVQGRVVYTSSSNAVQSGFVKQINLDNEAEGVYLMRVVADGIQTIQKVSVQR